MSAPEKALEQARAAAAAMRSGGAYREDLSAFRLAPEPLSIGKLMEWSVIEPDLRDVRSTRRLGAPITGFKHFLVRMLQQYHGEVLAQQTRFNVAVVTRLAALEARVEALEREEEQ